MPPRLRGSQIRCLPFSDEKAYCNPDFCKDLKGFMESQRDYRDDVGLLKARMVSLASSEAAHAYVGSLCGFYFFVMGQSACVSHPEWDSQDAEELAGYLHQRKINLVADSFGHYERMWDMERTVRIQCLFTSLESMLDKLDTLAELLDRYREERAEHGATHGKEKESRIKPAPPQLRFGPLPP